MRFAIYNRKCQHLIGRGVTDTYCIYLSESLGLGMFFEAERWEMDACSKHASLREDTDTSNAIDFHFHIRITVWISKVGEMRSPGGVFCISLHNDGILVQSISKGQGGFRLLPRVQVVWLRPTQPVRKWAPHIYSCVSIGRK